MRHRNKITKLSRASKHRVSMLGSLATDIILNGRVITTTVKAKVVRSYVERLVTYGKKNTLASKRNALKVLTSKEAFYKLFSQIAPIYSGRNGGYTRIYKLDATRKGDEADMALIELVDYANILPSKEQAAESESTKPAKVEKKKKDNKESTEAKVSSVKKGVKASVEPKAEVKAENA